MKQFAHRVTFFVGFAALLMLVCRLDPPPAAALQDGPPPSAEQLHKPKNYSRYAYRRHATQVYVSKRGNYVPMTVTNRAYTSPIWHSPK